MGGWTNPAGLVNQKSDAPLSTLLPPAPTPYSNVTTPGVSASSKNQYQADILGTTGTSTLGSGVSLLGQPLDYWQKQLVPPTKQRLTEEAAPAIASVVGQYSTGKKALAQQPRGGGTSAVSAELPFQEAGTITGLIEQRLSQYTDVLQPQAANAITSIAETLSALGLSELGLSSQDLIAQMTADLTKRGQNMQALGSLGQGIGTIISSLISKGGILNPGK